jgi:hypothetical protein
METGTLFCRRSLDRTFDLRYNSSLMITPLQEGILGTVHNEINGILRFLDTPEMADVDGIIELRTGLTKSKTVVGKILLKHGRPETNKEVIDGIEELRPWPTGFETERCQR